MKTFQKPIKCPECHRLLKIVQVERVTILEWESDPETIVEPSFEDNGQGSTTVRCYKCGKVVGESNANNSWGICPEYCD